MVEDKDTKKAPAKKTPVKTAGKATVKKPTVGKKASTSPKAQSEAVSVIAKKATGKKIKVTQIGSPIGRQDYQKGTLIGLGLNKMNKSRVLVDTPSVRGMIESIKHLVKVEEAA